MVLRECENRSPYRIPGSFHFIFIASPSNKKQNIHAPFFARSDASHAVQSIQYRLQARQNRAIQFYGERALQARLVLRLLEQVLQFDELDLQVPLPTLDISKKHQSAPEKKKSTYIAMNSSTDLFSVRGRSSADSSLGSSCSESTTSIGFSGENELDATRRVYSQPIFRQKLRVHRQSLHDIYGERGLPIVLTLRVAC